MASLENFKTKRGNIMNAQLATEIHEELPNFYGSYNFTRWSILTKSVLTDGTLYLA